MSNLIPSEIFQRIKSEVSKVVVGQEYVLKHIAIALLCRGHVILIGPPGLAKTTLVNSFASAMDMNFSRVQFTPDLMPTDITGTEILQENRSTGQKEFVFIKGPIFCNLLLADEINRTPPKTQSALLQAMQEKKVTAFGRTEILQEPFMVLATQNPIEQEGTYPLPEAQLDRFLFSLELGYPSREQELAIIKKHTRTLDEQINAVVKASDIVALQKQVLDMSVPEHVFEYALDLVRKTRPNEIEAPPQVKKYVKWGAGPRCIQFLILAAKAKALLEGKPVPTEKDVKELARPVLQHRVLMNFQAEAENYTQKNLLDFLLA